MSTETRRHILDDIARLNALKQAEFGDPEITTRIGQYELAFRMQPSVPELTDTSREPEHIFRLYGEDARQRGTYASHCLMARRLVERGVRFVQLFHRGWDQHKDLPGDLRVQCQSTDQPTAALILDLEQRGLLDETLIVWGGEFGRTTYCQGRTDQGQLRARSPSSLLHCLVGRGRSVRWLELLEKPMTSATTS